MKSRKGRLLAFVKERFVKLIVTFILGLVLVAMPASYVIRRYQTYSWISFNSFWAFSLNWKNYLDPGHISFLPYLFFLTIVHLPLLFCLIQMTPLLAPSIITEAIPTPPEPPKWFKHFMGLYTITFSVLIGWDASLILLAVAGTALIMHNFFGVENVSPNQNDPNSETPTDPDQPTDLYHLMAFSGAGTFISTPKADWNVLNWYNWFSALIWQRTSRIDGKFCVFYLAAFFPAGVWVLTWFLAFLQIPPIGLLCLYLFPVLLVFAPVTTIYFYPVPRFLRRPVTSLFSASSPALSSSSRVSVTNINIPVFAINLPLMGLMSIVLGQLLIVGWPERIHFLVNDLPEGLHACHLNIFELFYYGAFPRKKVYGLVLMVPPFS